MQFLPSQLDGLATPIHKIQPLLYSFEDIGMGQDKSAEVTRKLKRVAEEQFLRIMEEADRVDPDRTQGTTTVYRRMALSAALDAAIAALKPSEPDAPPLTITRDKAPTSYRLMRKTTGELVLQGAFFWHEEGSERAGFEWRDLKTEVEKADPNLQFFERDKPV